MSLRTDCRRAVAPWVHAPGTMLALHAIALYRVFVPYPANNDFRKLMASCLMLTWMAVTLGVAYDEASLGTIQYGVLSAVIYTIIGIQWGFEIDSLSPVEISVTGHTRDTDDE